MAEQETLVVASKIKAAIKAAGCNTGGDAVDAINSYVHWLVQQAAKRAVANGRKTVRGHDIMIDG
jgi:histone H3/H4